jgi:two-component system, chemotaxis family, response regulator Rcp1
MNTAKGRLILVVDDNEDDRMFVRNALSEVDPNVRVAEAVDGIDALDYLRDASKAFPDLILLDLKMPRKDGFETLADIRQDPKLRHLPVVAVFTTATDPEFVRRAYCTGANAYVGKPSNMASLREIMGGIVKHWFEIATLPENT